MLRLPVALLLFALPALAQFTTGRIEGTVSDPTVAPIANASLTLTALDTNHTRDAASGTTGAYFFAAVPPAATGCKPPRRSSPRPA